MILYNSYSSTNPGIPHISIHSFLDDFARQMDQRMEEMDNRIRRMENALSLMEFKLNSVPDASTEDAGPRSELS